MTIFFFYVSAAASVALTWIFNFFFFYSYLSKSKDFLSEQTPMWTVGIWPCSELLKKPRVSPICLIQTLSWLFFSLWKPVHWTCEEWWENRANVKSMPYSVWGENVRQHTAHIFFGGYSCLHRYQIALKICYRAVIVKSRGHLMSPCGTYVLRCLYAVVSPVCSFDSWLDSFCSLTEIRLVCKDLNTSSHCLSCLNSFKGYKQLLWDEVVVDRLMATAERLSLHMSLEIKSHRTYTLYVIAESSK